MKNIKILAMVLLLSGCSVESWELNMAANFCKGYENISSIESNLVSYNAICSDGTTKTLLLNARK